MKSEVYKIRMKGKDNNRLYPIYEAGDGELDRRLKGDVDIYRALVDQSGVVTGNYPVAGGATGVAGDQRGPLTFYTDVNGVDKGFLLLWRDNRSGVDYDLCGIKVWP